MTYGLERRQMIPYETRASGSKNPPAVKCEFPKGPPGVGCESCESGLRANVSSHHPSCYVVATRIRAPLLGRVHLATHFSQLYYSSNVINS